MANEYLGRQESVGFGIEGTPGTAVAPQIWTRHLSNGFAEQVTTLENESAMGRVERVNDSTVEQTWAEGSIEGKVADQSICYLLYSVFGTVNTTDNVDVNAAVKDHTFTVNQSNSVGYLTVAVNTPVEDLRHPLAVVDSLELSGEAGGWVRFTADVKAKAGASATLTPAYVAETEFTGKNISLKLDDEGDVAGLSSATNIDVRSYEITLARPATPEFALGSGSPTDMNRGAFEATGEFVIRFKNTDYKDDWLANTKHAMRFSIINTDVTIGTAANPGIVLTAPRASFRTFEKSDDLDEIVTATVGFSCELDTTAGYAINAVVTNTLAAVAAA